MRTRLAIAFCLVLTLQFVRAGFAADEPLVRITAPGPDSVFTAGDRISVEISIDASLKGSPVGLRLDGKSVWVGQQESRRSLDSAKWSAGKHSLQAVVFRAEDEVSSPVVWVEVVVPEAEQSEEPTSAGEAAAPELKQPPQEALEPASPTPDAISPAQGFQLPFSDGFEDEELDSQNWISNVTSPSFEVVESDHELRMSGSMESGSFGGAGVAVKEIFGEAVDCSVWFRVATQDCYAFAAWLGLVGNGGSVGVAYRSLGGYLMTGSNDPERLGGAPVFGDEASNWHKLRVTYDPSEGYAKGYVDEVLVGTVPASMNQLLVSVQVQVNAPDCPVDVRFDDFELRGLEKEPEAAPEPATEKVSPEPEGSAQRPAKPTSATLVSAPSAQRLALPFRDGFEGETLDSRTWVKSSSSPGMEVVESDHELRVSGGTESESTGGAGASVKAWLDGAVDCSVWFRVQSAGAPALAITTESGGAVRLAYRPAVGYVLTSAWDPRHEQLGIARGFGDETSEWHKLRLTYDRSAGFAEGYVDGVLLGKVPTLMTALKVRPGVVVEHNGCSVDVRFDDFEIRGLEPEAPPIASATFEEEAAEPESEPFLGPDDPSRAGEVVERRTRYGDYLEYVPLRVKDPTYVVVVVHGSVGDANMTPEVSLEAARNAILDGPWRSLADTKGVIIVAPSFDRNRFSGYRNLGGTLIGPDDFAVRIAENYRKQFNVADKIVLVGTSAGGQFVSRFLLTHPELVLAAVISSAGTFAYPDDSVEWPFGRLNSPYPEGFLKATQVPVLVTVGARDTKDMSDQGTAQRGSTHIDRAQAWVDAMKQLANDRGLDAKMDLVVLQCAGHSDWALSVASVWWLADIIDPASREEE